VLEAADFTPFVHLSTGVFTSANFEIINKPLIP
jgi:hypothetical protein